MLRLGVLKLPLLPLSSLFSGGQSLLMRIYLTQYSMKPNPVDTVWLRRSRYPLARSAAGPGEAPGAWRLSGGNYDRKEWTEMRREENITFHSPAASV